LFDLKSKRQLRRTVSIASGALFALMILIGKSQSEIDYLSASIVVFSALFPAFMWAKDPQCYGLPVFPAYAATFALTFGLPMISAHPKMIIYSEMERLLTAVCVGVFILLGSWVWRTTAYVAHHQRTLKPVRVLDQLSVPAFVVLLLITTIYELSNPSSWGWRIGGFHGILRAVLGAVFILSSFALSYNLGKKQLSTSFKWVFIVLLIANMMLQAVTLLLIKSAMTFIIILCGYFLGSKKLPWKTIICAVLTFAFLHAGKERIRTEVWGSSAQRSIGSLYSSWAGHSINRLSGGDSNNNFQSSKTITDRVTLAHLFLLANRLQPEPIGYLYGATYKSVPAVFIPRIFWPSRPTTLEGTRMINIHFRLQRIEDTLKTTIGWGLFNEFFVNFGYLGIIGGAVLMGFLLGLCGRLSAHQDVFSVRTLSGFLVLFFLMHTETTMAQYVASIFQAHCGLFFLFMFLPTRLDRFKPSQMPVQQSQLN